MSRQYHTRADRNRISKSPGVARCFMGRGRASLAANDSRRDRREMASQWREANIRSARMVGRMPPKDGAR